MSVQTIYSWFWNDFCDWYLERAKAKLDAGGETKKTTQRVLAFALDTVLRLLQPTIPFICEAIWERLNVAAPDRALTAEVKAPASRRVIIAQWPNRNDALRDEAVDAQMDLLQGIVRAVREIRGQMQIAPRQPLEVVISAGDRDDLIRSQGEFIMSLAVVDALEVAKEAPRPSHAASAVVSGVEVFVPLEGLIDFETERARLRKSIEKTEKGLKGVSGKLSNENFVKRAKPEVVESERARQAELQAQRGRLNAALDALEN